MFDGFVIAHVGVIVESLFKEKFHAILLTIFEAQDSYADLNTIISDFKKY